MPITVEVFTSPGCAKCGEAKARLRRAAAELGADRVRWREVDVLEDLDRAVALGVLSAPAIAIDGELAFARLPSERTLCAALETRLRAATGA
jgi:predicted DsbA family dithiol-disulfide isomerase